MHTNSSVLGQDQSTVAQRAETTVAECFLMSCMWTHFPWYVPTLGLDSIVSRLQLYRVKDVCMFRCNLPPAILAKWPGSFTCLCSNMGWNGHRIRVSTQSQEENLHITPAGTGTCSLSNMSPALYQQAIPAPIYSYSCVQTTYIPTELLTANIVLCLAINTTLHSQIIHL